MRRPRESFSTPAPVTERALPDAIEIGADHGDEA
jgi:hypothetical protein